MKNKIWYLLLFPSLLLITTITFYPLIFTISWSLFSGKYLTKGQFIGLMNYKLFFLSDAKHAFRISLLYTVGSLVGSLFLGTVVALLLHQPLRGRTLFRTLLLTPWVLSQTVVALLWKWFLDPYYGPLANLFARFGLSGTALLGSPRTALAALVVVNVWASYPQVVVLILAALQTIPKETIEAAVVDGATAVQRFFYVMLPALRHQYLVASLILGMLYFNMVTLIYVSTAGGPSRATETLSVLLFKVAFERWQLGYASAISVVMIILNAMISVGYIRLVREM